MKNYLPRIIVALATTVLLSNCSNEAYSGDGRLIDNGPFAAADRYVLDLGEIALDTKGSYKFELERLPSERFVIGVQILATAKQSGTIEGSDVQPTLLIQLTGPDDTTIFRDQSRLSDWTWSVARGENAAFVYRRDEPSTFFTPDSNRRYELTVEVVQPELGDMQFEARILAKSGGWK